MSNAGKRIPLRGRAAWTGKELESDDGWVWHLDDTDIAEIDIALEFAAARNLSWQQLSQSNFPLGNFAPKIAGLAEELEDGRGIVLLRGPAR